jgi:hypothetical protein
MSRHAVPGFALVLFGVLMVSQSATAATLVVDDDGGAGVYTSIQAALNAAQPGDTVFVRNGTYREGRGNFLAGSSSYAGILLFRRSVRLVGESTEGVRVSSDLPAASRTAALLFAPGAGYCIEVRNLTLVHTHPGSDMGWTGIHSYAALTHAGGYNTITGEALVQNVVFRLPLSRVKSVLYSNSSGFANRLRNVTVDFGAAGTTKGAVTYVNYVSPKTEIRNSILSNTTGNSMRFGSAFSGTQLPVHYSVLWGAASTRSGTATANVGDLLVDPRFVNAAAGDFHLAAGSPARASGDPSATYNNPDGTRTDMGAFGTQGGPGVACALPPSAVDLATTTSFLTPAADASLLVGPAVTLSAKVADANGVPVKGPGRGTVTFSAAGLVVGTDGDADGDGVFHANWDTARTEGLTVGEHELRAEYSGVDLPAPQGSLLASAAVRRVSVPYAPPSVTLCHRPASTREATLHVCGYVTPKEEGASAVRYAFVHNGGAPVEVWPSEANANSGFVETWVQLVEGPNEILLTATDDVGSTVTRRLVVVRDTVAPVLTVLSPVAGQALGSGSVAVTSRVVDVSPTRVVTQYAQTTNLDEGGGTVTHAVTLAARGYVTLVVTATDAAGNVAEQRLQVWVDAVAPGVSTTPADGAVVGPRVDNLLPYTVRVDALSATTVTLPGGRSVEVPRGGGSVQALLALSPGLNTFQFQVRAETGLVTSVTRTVKYDVAAPVAVTVVPTAGGTYGGIITLTATVTDDFSGVKAVGFMRDRSGIRAAVAGPNNTWTLSFDTHELADGRHTINVWVRDGVGNTAISDTEVFIQNAGP